jgi:hypothetical protein
VEATDRGVVDLSGVADITGGGSGANGGGPLRFVANSGGHINLANATHITGIHAGIEFLTDSLALGNTNFSHVNFTLSPQTSWTTDGVVLDNTCNLSGGGHITGNLDIDGQLSPGNSPGLLSIDGNLTLTANAVLEMVLSGRQSDEFDRLDVTGIATLDGRLSVVIDASLTLMSEDSFALLTASERRGAFADYVITGEPGAVEIQPSYDPDAVILVARPPGAPTVLSLLPGGVVDFVPTTLTVTFSEFVNPASFTAAEVTIIGPTGTVNVVDVWPISAPQFAIDLPPLPAVGRYAVTLGPDIADAAGLALNQDGDEVAGEAGDDVFSQTFDVAMANLAPSFTGSPADSSFGNEIELSWQVENRGNAAATGNWVDRVWLSTDATLDAADRLLHSEDQSRTLTASSAYSTQKTLVLPLTASLAAGDYFFVVEANADANLSEFSRIENRVASPVTITYDTSVVFYLSAGWNLVGMPIVPDETAPSDLFRGGEVARLVRGHVLGVEQGIYTLINDIAIQDAFWLFCDKAATVQVAGTRVLRRAVEFAPGWTGHASLGNEAFSSVTDVLGLWWWDATKAQFRLHPPDQPLTQGRGYLFDNRTQQVVEFDLSE